MTSEEFKHLRESLGLTQKEIADLIGLSHDYVRSIEGKRRIITPANELLIYNRTREASQQAMRTKDVQSKFNKNISDLKSKGYSDVLPQHNESMMMITMANATTSSVTLDLVCEVLSSVSGENLRLVKARAKKLGQEKAQKLDAVLTAMF